jgi:hypothetical protein
MKDDASEEDSRTKAGRGRDPLDVTASPTAISLKEPAVSVAPSSRKKAPSSLRRWGLLLAVAGLGCVVVINVILISGAVSSAREQQAAATAPPPASASASGAVAALPTSAAGATSAPDPGAGEAGDDDAPPPDPKPASSAEPEGRKAKENARARTVQQAAEKSCSTAIVDGLSRQIIRQSRCIDPNAFVAVPAQPNLETSSHVFLYMERSARDQLVHVLSSHRGQTMSVHSALRTVAQQFLLRRWATSRRCGIQLATPPGESNHETGLALDIGEPSKWRSALEAQGFAWLGSIDKVHFDYKGKGASSRMGVDVMAFQQLWNRNHPDEPLVANGQYTAATEARLKSAPAGGFPVGPGCEKAPASTGPHP